jgi:hypothetical protein
MALSCCLHLLDRMGINRKSERTFTLKELYEMEKRRIPFLICGKERKNF